MMIVDHLAAGILLPHTIKNFQNGPAIAVSMLAASLPDLTILFSGWKGSIGYLSHRGASHSMVLAFIFSLLPVLIIYFAFKRHLQNTFLELYALSTISYLVHACIDLVTPYGTKILYPILKKPFSLDFIHCFDPFVILLSISVIFSFIYALFHKQILSRPIIVVWIGLYCLYGGITLVRKINFSQKYRSAISAAQKDANYLVTVPRTFWRWKGIASTPSGFLVAAQKGTRMEIKRYNRNSHLQPAIMNDDFYNKFIEYARFPVIESDHTSIAMHNLIYSPISYRLVFTLDDTGKIFGREVTGFEITDKNI